MKTRSFFIFVGFALTAIAGLSSAALLNVQPTYPLITFQSTINTAVTYNASTQLFSADSPVITIQFSSSESARPVTGTRLLKIRAIVDHSGNLVSGVSGDDFTLSGTVTRIVGGVTNTYTGVLLTGEVQAFGFADLAPSTQDRYDFRFTPTGGALLSFYSCGNASVAAISENSTFTGSFLANFIGRFKGTVGLEDLIPPTVTCPFGDLGQTNVECNAGSGGEHGAFVSFPNPTGTDNCDTNLTFVYSPPSGSFFPLEPTDMSTNYPVMLTATDASGNQGTCTFTVTIQDTLAPEFDDNSSPVMGDCGEKPFILTNDVGECYATFMFTKPTAVNLCCPAVHTVTVSAVDENGAVITVNDNGDGTAAGYFPVTCHGTNILIIVAADDRGNTAQHECPIIVVDADPPVIACVSNQYVECTGGPVFFQEPTAYDNCPSVTVSCTPTNGSVLDIGTHEITYSAADCSGHTNLCTFDVIVQDTTPPSISCPLDTSIQCGDSTDPSSTGTATAGDICDALPTVTFTDAVSGNWQRTITRTWKAVDASSNSITCVQTITISDTTPPAITCPPDKQLACGDSTAPSNTGIATATDSCDTNVTVTYSDAATPANCTGKPGIDRTWKATDASGNVATCVQHITFVDTAAPAINCPPDKQLACGASTDPSNTGTASATDNCGGTVTITYADAAAPANCTGKDGINRTWTATDGCGNASTCLQHITFVDTTAPSVTVPTGSNLGCNPAALPTDAGVKALVTATDNCGTPVVSVSHADVNNGCTITRSFTVTATDGCGNASAAQTVVYTWTADTTAPSVTVPAGGNLGCNPSSLPTDGSVRALVTVADNCSAPIVNVSHADANNDCAITRTFTVTAADGCGNVSAPQTVAYTWTTDTTAPSVTVPAGGNLGCNPASLPTDASVKALVTADDDCGTPVVNVSHVDANNGCAVTRTFTVTATDGCGNASVAQTVVYTWTADTTPPTITCPAAITVSSLPAPNPSSVTASDNCAGTVTKSFVSDSVVTNGCQIVVTRTYRATDACGNSATCTQTITVAPLISPTDCILWHAPLANSPANDDTDPSRINGQVSGTKYKYVFKGGSTIPIQVRVNGCTTADATTNPNVVAEVNVYADQNCDNLPDGNELLIDYNGVGEAGGVMDNVNGFKKYNLDTKTLTTPGCYVIEIVVTDSSTGQSCKERVLLQRK